MRRSVTVLFATAAVVAAVAFPAGMAQAVDTPTTFTLTAGTLDITAPAGPVTLGTVAINAANVGAAFGAVDVSDTRGAADSDWVASVNSTSFANGTNIIPAADAAYATGTVTVVHDDGGTSTPNDLAALATAPAAVVTHAGGTGVNESSWDPTITVTLPTAGTIAGTYTATVTHSVA